METNCRWAYRVWLAWKSLSSERIDSGVVLSSKVNPKLIKKVRLSAAFIHHGDILHSCHTGCEIKSREKITTSSWMWAQFLFSPTFIFVTSDHRYNIGGWLCHSHATKDDQIQRLLQIVPDLKDGSGASFSAHPIVRLMVGQTRDFLFL